MNTRRPRARSSSYASPGKPRPRAREDPPAAVAGSGVGAGVGVEGERGGGGNFRGRSERRHEARARFGIARHPAHVFRRSRIVPNKQSRRKESEVERGYVKPGYSRLLLRRPRHGRGESDAIAPSTVAQHAVAAAARDGDQWVTRWLRPLGTSCVGRWATDKLWRAVTVTGALFFFFLQEAHGDSVCGRVCAEPGKR